MPIIAESPPLLFGDELEPEPIPAPPVIIPSTPPAIVISHPFVCNYNDILVSHQIFIDHVDSLNACFKRSAMPEFLDDDFEFHAQLAMIDKYLTKSQDTYCSMQAVNNLSSNLKRFQD